MRLQQLIDTAKAQGLTVYEENGLVTIINKSVGVEIYHDNYGFYKAHRCDIDPSIALSIRTVKQCAAIVGVK